MPSTRALLLATIMIGPTVAARAQTGSEFPEGVAALTTWFKYVQRDELDSLPALLAPDFVFVSDGARFDPHAFVAMIKGLGISHPRVRLTNIVARRTGDVGYLVYDRTEAFQVHGKTKVVPETGTMVLTRTTGRWTIVVWTATSPRH